MAAPMRKTLPIGRLVFEQSSFKNEKEKHGKCIEHHYFNSSVHILLPGCEALPPDIADTLSGQLSFMAARVPLYTLIDPEFIEGFVKRGSVYVLSQGTCLDMGDCVALLPTGVLVMNLCKETYENLGLVGTKSTATKHTDKHVVEIDLTKKQFYPGTKYYDRVRRCLTDSPDMVFDLLLSWQPQDTKVCPSSIQNYFQSKNTTCKRIQITQTTHNYRDFTVPVISPDSHLDQSQDSCDHLEIFDWLGACACGIDLSDRDSNDFVSTFTCPLPNQTVKCGLGVQYTGMFTPDNIQDVVNMLRHHMTDRQLDWCSVSVTGFMDCPVAWQQRHHGFHNNGDNLYTLLMFKNQVFWTYTALGGMDTCP